MKTFSTLLKQHGLRDTQPRRMVMEAMQQLKKPVSPYGIQKWINSKGGTVSIVTVYRILAVLEKLNLVHRHACSGLISLCSLSDPKGHHGFLYCRSCGSVEEFSDKALCRAEDAIAKKAQFKPLKHVSEILGLCSSCLPDRAPAGAKAGVSSSHISMKKLLASVFILLLLSACSNAPQRNSGSKLKVAATFYPLAHFAEQVGGNYITVQQITPSGVEPHDYEPTPQELVGVQSAKLFLMNGGGLDPWAEKVKGELSAKGIVVVIAVDSVELLAGEEEGEHEEEEEEHGAFDPHIWLDPANAQAVVRRIRDVLIQVDPAHEDAYRSNADAYLAELVALDKAYRDGLVSCDIREVVTSHNAFNYLAKRYNLTILSIAGLSPEDEPSPKRMAEIADLAKAKKIDTIFFETLVSPKLSETIAQEIGAKTAVLNPIEGLTDEERQAGETYISLMEENLSQLRAALRCH